MILETYSDYELRQNFERVFNNALWTMENIKSYEACGLEHDLDEVLLEHLNIAAEILDISIHEAREIANKLFSDR